MVPSEQLTGSHPVFRMIYASESAEEVSREELQKIAAQAKKSNQEHNITGLLINCGKEFLQVLEGDHDMVLKTYERIQHDPRHLHVTTVMTEQEVQRWFSEWSMGCFELDPDIMPDGFLFAERNGERRLRVDALGRVDNLMKGFYQHRNHTAGQSQGFTVLAQSETA